MVSEPTDLDELDAAVAAIGNFGFSADEYGGTETVSTAITKLGAERDALRAEVERLKREVERLKALHDKHCGLAACDYRDTTKDMP